jgi:hypothetical protein
MARKAEIDSIRIKCNMHITETAEEYIQYVQELQNDGYVPCEPYYDDCGYAYFQKRIDIQQEL